MQKYKIYQEYNDMYLLNFGFPAVFDGRI